MVLEHMRPTRWKVVHEQFRSDIARIIIVLGLVFYVLLSVKYCTP